ncbi:MAG: hypothetical protein GY820_38025 [Gammaproteobacteria bacterium]|nr:hypothetical protein [Gammaproteobacteria bacterium]
MENTGYTSAKGADGVIRHLELGTVWVQFISERVGQKRRDAQENKRRLRQIPCRDQQKELWTPIIFEEFIFNVSKQIREIILIVIIIVRS